ncbi:MAG: DUF1080 domain-containing protein [Bacteroidales bacterium]|nr:DUF1080 domain-containing protein [Bacteroidales bacterium]
MKRNLFFCALFALALASLTANAQEDWSKVKQPRVVTPGSITTNSAPSDAIVLFDGTNLNEWRNSDGSDASWIINKDGTMTVNKSTGDILTRRNFKNYQLHLEWKVPADVTGSGQSRGNSGVYMQNIYEIQILDSYDNLTYPYGSAGSIYNQSSPLVNAMRKPGEWNVYDIIYTAPVFGADGNYVRKPTITIIHNGVLVQNNTEIIGRSESGDFVRDVKEHGDGPIKLQSHGDPSEPISFRNIWIREL